MKTKNTKRLIASLLLLCSLNSCDSFVEVDLPKSQLTKSGVFEDNVTADAALASIYGKIRDEGMLTGISYGLSNQLANYTDEITFYGDPLDPSGNFYLNALLPSNSDVASYWNTAYNHIYAANSIIEGVQASGKLSIDNKNRLQGEALFIRALLHFYLLNLFGDIPYVKQTDYRTNGLVTRMVTSEVYSNIIADLEQSKVLLSTNYSSTERTRANQYTAIALLSRVYLYAGYYAEAANSASLLLGKTDIFSLGQNINQVFLTSSKETIWQLKSAAAGQNANEGSTFIFLSGPPSTSALTADLVNSFSANDLRRANWIKSVSSGSSSWYHAYKYKERDFTASSKEFSIVFRLAEQYLIRAEARAQLDNLNGAREDINKIRGRAGLGDTPATTKEEVLAAVLKERRLELFTEFGHRFFDLKRFNQIDNVLSAAKPGWNFPDRLFPIPQSELSTNPKLGPQNSGY